MLLSLSCSLAALPQIAHADNVKKDTYRIRYALLLEGGPKILSEATCKLREDCVIYGAGGGDMRITINLGNDNINLNSIRIHCISQDCLFGNDRSTVLSIQEETHLQIYRGKSPYGLEKRYNTFVGDLVTKHNWVDPSALQVDEKV